MPVSTECAAALLSFRYPSIQVNDYTIKIEIETVQCSFLWFRPSGDRVLPLSMRYSSLALRRDMLRVGCNSSGISSMSAIEWPGWFKWEGTAAAGFAWSGLFVGCLCSLRRSRSVRLVSLIYCFFTSVTLDHICWVLKNQPWNQP